MDKNTLRVLREYLRNCAPRSISLSRKEKSGNVRQLTKPSADKKEKEGKGS